MKQLLTLFQHVVTWCAIWVGRGNRVWKLLKAALLLERVWQCLKAGSDLPYWENSSRD